MQSPPPYYASAPRKSNVGLIIAIIVGAIVLCCVLPILVLGYFGVGFMKSAFGFVGCSLTMGQLRDAMYAYADAHSGKLPPAASWQDDIAKYVKPISTRGESQPFKLPDPEGDVCDDQANTTFTYNSDLAGKKLDGIKKPDETVLIWETAGRGKNKSEKFKEPPESTAPKMSGIPRGWIFQPVRGEAYMISEGRKAPVGSSMRTRSGVRVETTTTGD